MLPGLDQVQPDTLPLITEILSLIDHSLAQGTALWPRQPPDALVTLRGLIEWAILEVLRKPAASRDRAEGALLRRFGDWLLSQRERRITLLSTNYDIAVEQHLYENMRRGRSSKAPFSTDTAREVDFGLSWLDPFTPKGERLEHQRPAAPALRVLKLHGSLNWLRCACCESIYINEFGAIASEAYRAEAGLGNTCDCGHAKLRMHIVAPSLFREVNDTNLLQVWRAALSALQEAEEWLIVGYSFPAEDVAIRSLFTRAYNVALDLRKAPPRVEVVQFDGKAEARYRAFFGGCDYRVGGLQARFPAP